MNVESTESGKCKHSFYNRCGQKQCHIKKVVSPDEVNNWCQKSNRLEYFDRLKKYTCTYIRLRGVTLRYHQRSNIKGTSFLCKLDNLIRDKVHFQPTEHKRYSFVPVVMIKGYKPEKPGLTRRWQWNRTSYSVISCTHRNLHQVMPMDARAHTYTNAE